MQKVLLIRKEKINCTLKEIEVLLKTEFRNIEYAMGFLDGYLFDTYRLMELKDFEGKLNTLFNLEDYFIKFITIYEEDYKV